MAAQNRADPGRHHLTDVPLHKSAESLRQIVLLHETGIVLILVLHVSLEHVEQRETELLRFSVRIDLLRKEQHHTLVLPVVLDGILGVEPSSVKHLVNIAVRPLLQLIKFALDEAHPVENEEHMKLRVALEV